MTPTPSLPTETRRGSRWSAAAAALALAALALLGAAAAAAASPANGEPPSPAGRLVYSPRSLSFDQRGQSATVTIRNAGAGPLRVGLTRIISFGSEAFPDFTVDQRGERELAPGDTSTIQVTYRPLGDTPRRQSFGALLIEADDPRLPAMTVSLPTARPGIESRVAGVALRAGPDSALLSWLVFAPLLGLPLLLFWPRTRSRHLRWIALGATAVPLLLAAWVVAEFDPGFTAAHGNFGLQFVQHVVWLPTFNVEYYVGVDGLSVGLVALTAIISFIAVLASWSLPADRNPRGFFALLLLLETGMLGVFVALDLFLFYVFWEVVLLPMYFLIGLWGGPRRQYAAIKFFLYTLVGAVLLLLGVLALYYGSGPTFLADGTPAAHTLDMIRLARDNDFASQAALFGWPFAHVVWLLLFIGFAVKVPLVPLHTWLPDAHVEAPTAVSVILAGVLLKMGTYGMLRVSWAILPEATQWAAPAVSVLGVVAILYGGFCALAQKDLKSLVAYSSISHMGFCLLGMASLTPLGLEGAVFQMLSHGFVSAMLFLLVGVLYDRTGERGLDAFGGVATVMPRYATFFGLGFMASLGLPGLSGFIGELMALLGSFGPFRIATVAAALGLVIAAGYSLIAIRRVQFGELPQRWRAQLSGHDLEPREWATLLPLAVAIVVLGFYPAPVLNAVATGVDDLLAVMKIASTGLGGVGK